LTHDVYALDGLRGNFHRRAAFAEGLVLINLDAFRSKSVGKIVDFFRGGNNYARKRIVTSSLEKVSRDSAHGT